MNALQLDRQSTAALLLRSLYRAYTGHASINVWLLSPKSMRSLVSHIPQLETLTELIIRLPPFRVTAKWPTHLLMQLPLTFFYWAPLRQKPISRLPLSIYMDETVSHWQDDDILLTKPLSALRDSRVRKLVKNRRSNGLVPVPLLQYHMDPLLKKKHVAT
jgi:hypothetical protein